METTSTTKAWPHPRSCLQCCRRPPMISPLLWWRPCPGYSQPSRTQGVPPLAVPLAHVLASEYTGDAYFSKSVESYKHTAATKEAESLESDNALFFTLLMATTYTTSGDALYGRTISALHTRRSLHYIHFRPGFLLIWLSYLQGRVIYRNSIYIIYKNIQLPSGTFK